MSLAEYDAFVAQLRAANVGQEAAERFAREKFPDAASERAEHRGPTLAEEKAVEHAGDKLMMAHGFRVIRFSQPRETKQTPGIADRRYYRPGDPPRSLWWEAKTISGHQSPAQVIFQELVTSCGETYLVGTQDVLLAYLIREGLFCD